MKLLAALGLAVVLAAALVGCSSGGARRPTGSTASAPTVSTDHGVTATQITVGVFADLSGPTAAVGVPLSEGAEAYFDARNDAGGICGRAVTVRREDTTGDPAVARQRYQAVAGDLVAIDVLPGGPTVRALHGLIAHDGIATFTGVVSASLLTHPDVFTTQAPLELQALNGLAWAATTVTQPDHKLALGVLTTADAVGTSSSKAASYGASRLPDTRLVASVSVAPDATELTAPLQKLQTAGAQVVWLHTGPAQTRLVLTTASQLGYRPLFLGDAASWSAAQTVPQAEPAPELRVVTGVASLGEDVPAMAELTAAAKKYFPTRPLENAMISGWIAAKVTTAALKAACAGGDLTRGAVVKAVDGLSVDLEGLGPKLSFATSPPDAKIPTRSSRVNEIGPTTGLPEPLTTFSQSSLATSWSLDAH